MNKWYVKYLSSDWKSTLGTIVFYSVVVLAIIGFIVVPKIQYNRASISEKCKLDLNRQHDVDKFCDINNIIQSKKAIADAEAKQAEGVRRAGLTPKQLCEEDHKSGGDPESGDYYYVFCKDNGTYDIKSSDELQNEFESDRADYESESQGTIRTYSQTYWYCWDTGESNPHHIGHPVSGDHYCTNQELNDAGF